MEQKMDVDESLYSRQLYVFGHDAQRKLASSNILIVGLNGLGIETAKNVILAGVKSVTLHDNTLVSYHDLASQFYLSELDVGQKRSVKSGEKLKELNPYVDIITNTDSIVTTDTISKHSLIILIDQPYDIQIHISEFCHLKNIACIVGDVKGVFGSIFCDFGSNFVVSDTNGEISSTCVIGNITVSSGPPADGNGTYYLITVLEENRHNLEKNDLVHLHGLHNADGSFHALNNSNVTVVSVNDAYTFLISHDAQSSGSGSGYSSGGYMTQVKQPVTLQFRSLAESVADPGMLQCDVMKMASAPLLHLAWRTMHKYKEKSPDNSLPQPGNLAHAQDFYDLAMSLNAATAADSSARLDEEELKQPENEKLLKRFALCCRGTVNPLCTLIGGILGQEALKACSGKFMPIQQWYYYNGVDALHNDILPIEEVTPDAAHPSRYDAQVMVWGKTMQKRMGELNLFLVGAGAIGCEMLKNWAMMGLTMRHDGVGGVTYVTDMDNIERSNLSRQFLFRNTDINQLKSLTACKAVHSMNPSFHCIAYDDKVGPETEEKFGDDFFDGIDLVCAALDNLEARLYLDQRCLLYRKPMFESGTLGTKGHTQVVIPGKTEHYGATRDPPEKSIPMCTLKSFPNKIEHTLQWAREWFEEVYKQVPENVNRYIQDTAEFKQHLATQSNNKLDILTKVKEFFDNAPLNYNDCLVWARLTYEDLYVNKISQLLYTLPLDKVGADGAKFWSGAKLPPRVILFDTHDPLHLEMLLSLADLRYVMYGLPDSANTANNDILSMGASVDKVAGPTLEKLNQLLSAVKLPQFQPDSNMKVALTEEEAKQNKQTSSEYVDVDTSCHQLLAALPPVTTGGAVGISSSSVNASFRVKVIDFDKDVDSHMRVVSACGNMRARNYRIPEADLHKARGIAGKIIPAIATTTAMVTGLICLELVKYVLPGDKSIDKFQNTFSNLALPMFTSAEPDPPKFQATMVKGKEWKWNQWDRVEIYDRPQLTLAQLIAHCDSEYGAELAMLSAGVSILYSSFSNPKKMAERKPMTLAAIYESVTKKNLPASQKYLILELILNDNESGDEMDMPYLRLKLR